MHHIPPAAPRFEYVLTIVYSGNDKPRVEHFSSVEEMGSAAHALALHARLWAPIKSVTAQSDHGHRFSVPELVAATENRYREESWRRWRLRHLGGDLPAPFRRAPVPYTGKRPRYSRSYLRQMRTMAERRLNALVLVEEGEVPARACRTSHNLPSSWDDIPREHDHGWKARHKGRKAWDTRR